jgi:hypothetical protein
VEVDLNDHQSPRVHEVIKDIEPFKSPVDGSIIIGRKSLREHNIRNNVTNVADFKETWAKAEKERERFYKGDASYDRAHRIEALKHAFEKHRRTK